MRGTSVVCSCNAKRSYELRLPRGQLSLLGWGTSPNLDVMLVDECGRREKSLPNVKDDLVGTFSCVTITRSALTAS